MKQRIALIFGMCLALIATGATQVFAQSPGAVEGQLKSGSDASLQNVTMDCLAVKFKLSKVHEEDGVHRVNLGQLYDEVSSGLIARLNARVVENHLDGADLIKKAAEYETALNNFKADYQDYEEQMNSLIKSDCTGHETAFYARLQSVQERRVTVDDDVQQLNRLMGEYKASAAVFYDNQIKKQNDKS